ncbi:MAG: hypothetical protein HFH45_06495 [Bacilli bacterium]|nr:hypothetical protein [Bacilli bacterium]
MDFLNDSIIEMILATITGITSFIGIKLKTLYEEKVSTETKKKIVADTVKYVEQITKDISITSENKKQKAKEKALEWLKEKKIKISDTELDILIESSVKNLEDIIIW